MNLVLTSLSLNLNSSSVVESNKFNEDDKKLFDELDKETYRIEINYVTKEKDQILRSVYFPFQEPVCLALIPLMLTFCFH